jgi:hypothetical protein
MVVAREVSRVERSISQVESVRLVHNVRPPKQELWFQLQRDGDVGGARVSEVNFAARSI